MVLVKERGLPIAHLNFFKILHTFRLHTAKMQDL